jgi:hypothetical protein
MSKLIVVTGITGNQVRLPSISSPQATLIGYPRVEPSPLSSATNQVGKSEVLLVISIRPKAKPGKKRELKSYKQTWKTLLLSPLLSEEQQPSS